MAKNLDGMKPHIEREICHATRCDIRFTLPGTSYDELEHDMSSNLLIPLSIGIS